MEREYFVVINGKQEGPFNLKSLQFKNLNKETLVWYDGLNEWMKAGELEELKSVVKATPPPVGNVVQNAPPAIPHTSQTSNPYTLAPIWKRVLGQILINFPLYLKIKDESDPKMLLILSFAYIATMAFCYVLLAGNLGHRIVGLKVISEKNGQDVTDFGKGFLREIIKSLLGILILPNLWLLFDSKKQNLYDKLTGTIVVERE